MERSKKAFYPVCGKDLGSKQLDISEHTVKTNRPTMKKSLSVPKLQIPALVKQSTIANITAAADKVKADILNLAENIKHVADKTFVMMKNKQVWFDRNNVALYPKFDHFTLPEFKTKG